MDERTTKQIRETLLTGLEIALQKPENRKIVQRINGWRDESETNDLGINLRVYRCPLDPPQRV